MKVIDKQSIGDPHDDYIQLHIPASPSSWLEAFLLSFLGTGSTDKTLFEKRVQCLSIVSNGALALDVLNMNKISKLFRFRQCIDDWNNAELKCSFLPNVTQTLLQCLVTKHADIKHLISEIPVPPKVWTTLSEFLSVGILLHIFDEAKREQNFSELPLPSSIECNDQSYGDSKNEIYIQIAQVCSRKVGDSYLYRPIIGRNLRQSLEAALKQTQEQEQGHLRRIEFAPQVAEEAAHLVRYHCSNPTCGIATRGPHISKLRHVTIGQAAHIYPASQYGPRAAFIQKDNIKLEFIRGRDNCIWLCRICHHIVDEDPSPYPPQLLLKWKREAENVQKQAAIVGPCYRANDETDNALPQSGNMMASSSPASALPKSGNPVFQPCTTQSDRDSALEPSADSGLSESESHNADQMPNNMQVYSLALQAALDASAVQRLRTLRFEYDEGEALEPKHLEEVLPYIAEAGEYSWEVFLELFHFLASVDFVETLNSAERESKVENVAALLNELAQGLTHCYFLRFSEAEVFEQNFDSDTLQQLSDTLRNESFKTAIHFLMYFIHFVLDKPEERAKLLTKPVARLAAILAEAKRKGMTSVVDDLENRVFPSILTHASSETIRIWLDLLKRRYQTGRREGAPLEREILKLPLYYGLKLNWI